MNLCKILSPLLFCAALVLCGFSAKSQSNLLERKISFKVEGKTLEETLTIIGKKGEFNFAYNSLLIPVDSLIFFEANEQSVKSILGKLLGESISFNVRGHHIILQQNSKKSELKQKTSIEGRIYNAETGASISNATVYVTEKLKSSVSDDRGNYDLDLSIKTYQTIYISRIGYRDTLLVILPSEQYNLNVSLQPHQPSLAQNTLNKIRGFAKDSVKSVEQLGFVKFLTNLKQRIHSLNVNAEIIRPVQVSLVPMVGTNHKLSGVVSNYFSLNIFAGYNGGVKGAELGGFVNIIRNNVLGLQIGGFANIVGKKTTGGQLAGFFNVNLGQFRGWQAAGFFNATKDTMIGAQTAGFFNLSMKKFTGVQAAGFANIATKKVTGVQVAGFTNYADSISGFQGAGFINVNRRLVKGGQAAVFVNYAGSVRGVQAAVFINIVAKDIHGVQISNFINYAKNVKGVQLGILNIADSVRGIPIGLLSIVRKGYHHLDLYYDEVNYLNASIKTGVRYFYNIITGGYNWSIGNDLWRIGYGLGSEFRMGKKKRGFTDLDLTVSYINKGKNFITDLNLLTSFNLDFGYRFHEYFSIYAGPGVKVYNSRYTNPETGNLGLDLDFHPVFNNIKNGQLNQVWFGFRGGIRI